MGLVVEMEAASVLEMQEMVLVWDPRRDLLRGRKRGLEGVRKEAVRGFLVGLVVEMEAVSVLEMREMVLV